MSEILVPIIDKALKKRTEQYVPKHNGGGSMGQCFRKRYMARMGVKQTNPINVEKIKLFELGNALHDIFKKYFKDEGVLAKEEVEVKDKEFDFSGYADAIVKIGGTSYVVEGKSISFKAFQHLGMNGKPEHIFQLASYVHFLNKKNPNITKGKLLYISKEPTHLVFAERPLKQAFVLTNEWRKKVENDLNKINNYLKTKTLPPKLKLEVDENGVKTLKWECRYCQYQDYCYPQKRSETNQFKQGQKTIII